MLCVEELRADKPKCRAAGELEACCAMCEHATQPVAVSDRHSKEHAGRATSMNSADKVSPHAMAADHPCIRLLTLAVGSCCSGNYGYKYSNYRYKHSN